jgi:hypothetical protein
VPLFHPPNDPFSAPLSLLSSWRLEVATSYHFQETLPHSLEEVPNVAPAAQTRATTAPGKSSGHVYKEARRLAPSVPAVQHLVGQVSLEQTSARCLTGLAATPDHEFVTSRFRLRCASLLVQQFHTFLVVLYHAAGDIFAKYVDLGLGKLAGAHPTLKQHVQLGKCPSRWLRHAEVGVDDAEEAYAALVSVRVSVSDRTPPRVIRVGALPRRSRHSCSSSMRLG